MRSLIVLTVVGLVAQLVDGSLGMSYGATSTSLLLIAGVGPAVASASVHLAEVGTTLVSGASHWRFGNVDRRVLLRLAVPGALGAFLGATVLARLSTAAARPLMAVVLVLVGLRLLVRFARRGRRGDGAVALIERPLESRFLSPLGLVAGFVDATGGGGWGPIATPSLLLTDRMEPRRVIGTVSAAEFMVTLAASAGFLLALGTAGFDSRVVLGLLGGGVVAAPIAAWLVQRVDAGSLGLTVGGLLILTNSINLLASVGVPAAGLWLAAATVVSLWAVAVLSVRRAPPAAA